MTKYKRVIIKLSGEALAGEKGFGIDESVVDYVVNQIKKVYKLGVEIGVIIGGGNFWRGRTSENIDRTKADQIGMLATVMNGLAVATCASRKNIPVRVQTAIEMRSIAEPYIRSKAIRRIWRRDGWSSSAAAPAAHSSPPIRRRYSGRRRSTRISFCLPRMWMGYTAPTP